MKTIKLAFLCVLMRIKFMIDPSARKRDLEEITKSYNLPEEGFKYLQWRNEYTVSRFFYTWKMIEDFFKTNIQVGILRSLRKALKQELFAEPENTFKVEKV